MISFTGFCCDRPCRNGRAAATIKKVFLELGGKSAFVVLDDARPPNRCQRGIGVLALHARRAGCLCHDPAGEAVMKRQLPSRQPCHRSGPAIPTTPERLRAVDFGRNNLKSCARATSTWRSPKAKVLHAVALTGRIERSVSTSSPTVIAGLTNDARVAREEIFGPVLGDCRQVTMMRCASPTTRRRLVRAAVYGADPQRAGAAAAGRRRRQHHGVSGTAPTRRSAA